MSQLYCVLNFVSSHIISFVNSLAITWHTNSPLLPWQAGYFERLIISTKESLSKELYYAKLQTILLEVETIFNNCCI